MRTPVALCLPAARRFGFHGRFKLQAANNLLQLYFEVTVYA